MKGWTRLASELREALDDPKRGEWGGYPWEHLGDAERDVRKLLAALDAERSRAEQWERDAKTNGEMYQGEYERHQQTKACIRELEEENLALRVSLRDERLSRRSALRRALRWKLALYQDTKREGEE